MDKIQKLLNTLTPDQQQLAKSVATMRLENKALTTQLTELKKQHEDLWRVMIVILDNQPGKLLRVHDSQFKRFKEEYRIDRSYDEEASEVVLRLLTVFDDVGRR